MALPDPPGASLLDGLFGTGLSQHARLITLASAQDSTLPEALLPERFTGREAVNELFRFEIHALSTSSDLELTAFIGEEITLKLLQADGVRRAWHGICTDAAWRCADGCMALSALNGRCCPDDELVDNPAGAVKFPSLPHIHQPPSKMRFIVQQLALLAFFILQTGCASVSSHTDEPGENTPHTIHLVQYGWHTALLFDAPSMLSRSGKLRSDFHDHKYLMIGWGDGAYFVAEHPPWSKAVKALVASDYPALQVVGRETNPPFGVEARDSIPLALTERGYQKLVRYIDDSIAAGPDGKPIYLLKQEGNPDRFYQATGSYSLFNNCNSWLADALRAAELPISGFDLTARSVFEKAVRISTLQQQGAAALQVK